MAADFNVRRLGSRRSEVRILSPRPFSSKEAGQLHAVRLFLFFGEFEVGRLSTYFIFFVDQ